MKKILYYLFFFITISMQLKSIEINGEIKDSLKLLDLKTLKNELNLKLDFKYKGDNFYSQIRINGEYITESSIVIDRAYIEIYQDKLSLSVGKQRIANGFAYLFNYTDMFNEVNLRDPKWEKNGVNALKARYDFNSTSKLECVGIYNEYEKIDYSIRNVLNFDKIEISGNYIKITPKNLNNILSTNQILSKYFVFEIKGEYVVGLWGEIVYKESFPENLILKLKDFVRSKENIYVFGSDYTFSFGENKDFVLYLLGEFNYNKTFEEKDFYMQSKLTLFKDFDIILGLLENINKKNKFITTSVNYNLNDYVSLILGYDRFLGDNKFIAKNNENEIYFILKSNF